jgi:hypothetical protein
LGKTVGTVWARESFPSAASRQGTSRRYVSHESGIYTSIAGKGRSVIIVDPSKQEGSKYARESMVRVVWYMIHAALEDEETQKKGIVVIANPKNAKFSQFDQKQDSMIVASLKGILPMRLSEIHICNPPYFFRILFPIVKIFVGERLRKRVNVHSGSDEKVLDRLDKFGLKREDLPSDLGGQIVLDHDGWLEDRKHDGK